MAEQGSVGFEFCVSCGEGTLLDYGICGPLEMNKTVLDLWPDRSIEIEMPDVILADAETTFRFTSASPDCETGE